MTLLARPLPPLPPSAAQPTQPTPRLVANATLVDRKDLSDRVAIFRVRLDTPDPVFLPGQYVSLGLWDGSRIIRRPYSIASPPGCPGELEFFIRRVEDGAFTSRLWVSPPDSRLLVGSPKGLFTLDRSDQRDRLFIASGTGLAPFMSMLGAERLAFTLRPVLLLQGASHASEFGFRERIDAWQRRGLPLEHLTTVSRPGPVRATVSAGYQGRVETLLARVCAERSLGPGSTVAYLCGNPGMIDACQEILHGAGFGTRDIHIERYRAEIPAGRAMKGSNGSS